MATWTNIPNANLEPNAPARAIDVTALRDNPVAIAEGAPGAPRIEGGALETDVPIRNAVAAGNFVVAATGLDFDTSGSVHVAQFAWTHQAGQARKVLGRLICPVSGTIRVAWRSVQVGSGDDVDFIVRRNSKTGTILVQQQITDTETTRTANISISAGDELWVIMDRGSSTGETGHVRWLEWRINNPSGRLSHPWFWQPVYYSNSFGGS